MYASKRRLGLDTGVFLFFTLFQLAALTALLSPLRATRRRDIAILVTLLAINATLTFWTLLESAGFPVAASGRVYAAIDAPSGALILAFVLARKGHARAAWTVVGVGGLIALGAYLVHPIKDVGIGWWFNLLFVSGLYHVALALVVIASWNADAEGRWVALAFFPRALLFMTQSISGSVQAYVAGDPFLSPSGVMMAASGVVSAVYAVRMVFLPPLGPSRGIIFACILVGPADAIAWAAANAAGSAGVATQILNYITLAFVRPLFLVCAFIAERVRKTVAHPTLAAGIGTSVLLGGPLVGIGEGASAILALSFGSLALALLGGTLLAPPARTFTPTAPLEVEDPSGKPPQWVLIVRALRGSSLGGPTAEFTQKNLALRTGLSVKRVSEFPEELNAAAERKLDAHVPGWRGPSLVQERPTLVLKHKGAVPGLKGAWVYYTLTPLGERLANEVEAGFSVDPSALEPSI